MTKYQKWIGLGVLIVAAGVIVGMLPVHHVWEIDINSGRQRHSWNLGSMRLATGDPTETEFSTAAAEMGLLDPSVEPDWRTTTRRRWELEFPGRSSGLHGKFDEAVWTLDRYMKLAWVLEYSPDEHREHIQKLLELMRAEDIEGMEEYLAGLEESKPPS